MSTEITITAAERQMRVDLAACYRLHAELGWTDLVFTHISARVPDGGERLEDPAEIEAALARVFQALEEGRSAVLQVAIGPH